MRGGASCSATPEHSLGRHGTRSTPVRQPVDVVLHLAPIATAELSALARAVRTGGVVLNTVPTAMPKEMNGVRAVAVFVRSDPDQLGELVAKVDAGELNVDIAERLALSELSTVHARAEAGALSVRL